MKKLLILFLLKILNSIFAKEKQINHKFEEYKMKIRNKIMSNSIYCEEDFENEYSNTKFLNYLEDYKQIETVRQLRTISPHDRPGLFFCDKYKTNINDFPKEAESNQIPWSGYYWPIKIGVISARYCNNEKNSIKDYITGKDFTWRQSVKHYLQPEEHEREVATDRFEEYVNNYYSPSEKYDLLIGDTNYTLTNLMKNEGNYVEHDKNGDVPDWMGICHGWAPASFLSRTPRNSVKVTATDGKTIIEFLPDDIKALSSLFWAETNYRTKFMGGRCIYTDVKQIPSDPKTGLWEEDTCYSINPAAFMIVMGNQIGIRKKNLIFDPQINGEIWNQPVYGYNLKFFNILNEVEQDTAAESKVPISKILNLNNTLFNYMISKKDNRSEFYLGVNMTVFYTDENTPIHLAEHGGLSKESIKYSFILELDNDNNIVGGEWLDNFHPNFIWTLDENDLKRRHDEDKFVESYNGRVDELMKFRYVAVAASSRKKILKAIVDHLLNLSAGD